MSTITDEMVRAAIHAQSKFRIRLSSDGELLSVYDERGEEPVEIGRYDTREEAENAVLWRGQRAALEAAERAAWRPIEEAPMGAQVLVRPQNPRFVQGYVASLRALHDENVGGPCLFLEDGAGRRFVPQGQLFRPLPSPPKGEA